MIMEITKHALERAGERLNLSKYSFTKMAQNALIRGKKHSECKGRLKRYVTSLYLQYKTANNICIYAENIFFFADEKLITVYRCPNEYLNHLKLK